MCKIHITDEHCGWLVAEHQPLGKFMKMVGGGTPTIGEINDTMTQERIAIDALRDLTQITH
jgi:hypothetical protein